MSDIEENQQSAIVGQPPNLSGPKKGRKSGAKNWKAGEVNELLCVCEEILPTGRKQWENVAAELYKRTNILRAWDGCKKKMDKMWSAPKPTGNADVPAHILKAQDIRKQIDRQEVIGYVVTNDASASDEDDDVLDNQESLSGSGSSMNLLDENGNFRRPTPLKRKATELANSIDRMADMQNKNAEIVSKAITEMAKTMTGAFIGSNDDGNYKNNVSNERFEQLEEKVGRVENSLSQILDILKNDK